MRSATSCFNTTLYRKNLTRFWPIWTIYSIIWLALLPLTLLTSYMGDQPITNFRGYDINPISLAYSFTKGELLYSIHNFSILLSFVFGLLAAMAVFSYLYNSRSAGMFHALPVRREGLFLTSYLSGLSFLILPQLLVFLVMLAVEAAVGALCFSSLFIWLLVQIFTTLFCYSFAVFCAMFTGHVLALPVFYTALNFVAAGVLYLTQNLCHHFLYGFVRSDWFNTLGNTFSPTLHMYAQMSVAVQPDGAGNLTTDFSGLGVTMVYGLIGLLLAGVALFIYRRRHLESAGDVVSIPWVRPIFKYGVAFCTAIVFGSYAYSAFFYSTSLWFMAGLILSMGILGYFAAEMLLKKTLRVFRKGWKGCAVFTLALLLCICALRFDFIGFETRVPTLAEGDWATMNVYSTRPNDDSRSHLTLNTPEQLALLTRLHTAITENRNLKYFDWDAFYQSEDEELAAAGEKTIATGRAVAVTAQIVESGTVELRTGTTLEFTYQMQDGKTSHRSYTIPVTAALLADPNSPAALLTELINRPELVWQSYFDSRGYEEEHRLVNTSTSCYDTEKNEYVHFDPQLDAAEYEALFQAVQNDMAAGRLGRRYLMDTEERVANCYYNDLVLTFYRAKAPGYDERSYDIGITLQSTATETLAVLRDVGLIDDTHILVRYTDIDTPVPGMTLGEDQLAQMEKEGY